MLLEETQGNAVDIEEDRYGREERDVKALGRKASAGCFKQPSMQPHGSAHDNAIKARKQPIKAQACEFAAKPDALP